MSGGPNEHLEFPIFPLVAQVAADAPYNSLTFVRQSMDVQIEEINYGGYSRLDLPLRFMCPRSRVPET